LQEMAENIAFRYIVKKLVSGEMAPGSSVYESAFIAELGLSRMPVRQAFNKAVSLGILKRIHGRRGYFLPELSLEDLVMVMEMRMLLEGTAAFKAAKYATYEDIYRLKMLQEEDYRCFHEGTLSEYAVSNEKIHNEIVNISRNPYLQHSFPPVYWRSSLYDYKYLFTVTNSPLGVAKTYQENRPVYCDQHAKIVMSIEKNDPESARSTMEFHVKESLEFLKHSIRFNLNNQAWNKSTQDI